VAIEFKIKEIEWLAPVGLQISLRIRFGSPLSSYNSYSSDWVQKYTELGLMMHDPSMKWAYENTGTCRWSTLENEDTHSVLKMAASYGIIYGAVISCRTDAQLGHRSIATFGRDDREFEDAELTHLNKFVQKLHDTATPPTNITDAEIEALLLLKRGLIIKEVAAELNISENAVKQRMSNARRKLGAKTTIHAASLAQQYGLI
jgi:DNA-binding CsgD family transcriptional regulator